MGWVLAIWSLDFLVLNFVQHLRLHLHYRHSCFCFLQVPLSAVYFLYHDDFYFEATVDHFHDSFHFGWDQNISRVSQTET